MKPFENLSEFENRMLESALFMCEEGMRNEGGLCPMLIMREDKTGEIHTLNLEGVEKGMTGTIINGARTLAAVVFVAEAWTTTLSAPEGSAIAKAVREDPANAVITAPHDCPDRREAVMVQYFHHARHILLTSEVTRTPGSNPTLGEWRRMDNADPNALLHKTNFSPPGARLV